MVRSVLSRFAARTSAAPAARRYGAPGATFIRTKITLPDLPYDYGALEPAISGKIMELHHSKHHKTYVDSYNNANEQLQNAISKQDIAAQISLKPLINFHGGGHLNHSLFWQNLTPKSAGGGTPPTGVLAKLIDDGFGGLEKFKSQFNTALAGVQGSGWAWLVQDTRNGAILIKTCANQDPVLAPYRPLLGIDAWEHAYYLQYENRKAEYFKAIWDVVNWKAVQSRLP